MAMNLPTPPTQGPRRPPVARRGSLLVSSARSFASDSGESAAPATSGITPPRSAMPPSASNRPGRSAPTEPTRTSFKCLSLVSRRASGGRQTGRPDGLELLVRQDEFLVTQRLGLRELASGQALHQLEDLAAHVVEL